MKTCDHCGQPMQGGADPIAKAPSFEEGGETDLDAEDSVLQELIALMGSKSVEGLKKPEDEGLV